MWPPTDRTLEPLLISMYVETKTSKSYEGGSARAFSEG